MNLLAIKTAVITGAASGIGLALATKAARLGMRVVLADVEKDKLITVTNSLSEQNYKVLACPTDVTKEKDLINLANQTISHFGVPDLLINNAGIGGAHWSYLGCFTAATRDNMECECDGYSTRSARFYTPSYSAERTCLCGKYGLDGRLLFCTVFIKL